MKCEDLPRRDPVLGKSELRCGNITTLQWIAARDPAELEASLGFGPGRLNAGYWILLISGKLAPEDFIFEGTTLNSGGALGLPGDTREADDLRVKMHERILRERGPQGYKALQEARLKQVNYSGSQRLARVHARTGHDEHISPKDQYPMGGGGLQWRIIKPVRFYVACYVYLDMNLHPPRHVAQTPRFNVNLQASNFAERLDNRMRLSRYLSTAS